MMARVTLKQGHGLSYVTPGGRNYKVGVTQTITSPRDIAEVQGSERFAVEITPATKATGKVKAPVAFVAEEEEEEEPPLDAGDLGEVEAEEADEQGGEAEAAEGGADDEARVPKKKKPRAKAAKAKV